MTASAVLPREVALVCVLTDSPLLRTRWSDLYARGGYLSRIVDRIVAHAGAGADGSQPGTNLRLSLVLTDLSSPTSYSPISHTQYFLPPSQFFPTLAARPPPSARLSKICSGEEDLSSGCAWAAGWEDEAKEGLLEGIVAALELFTYHQTRPFPSTTAFTDLPLPTFTPIPNTTPLNLPPLPHSSATSPNPASAPAPARGPIERHLIIFTDDGKVGEDEEVRWNNEARFDGVKWANVAEETGRMDIKTSLIVLDQAGELEGVDGRLTGLVAGTDGKPAGQAWFPTKEGDKFFFPASIAPPSAKRPLQSPVKREDTDAKKRKLTASLGLGSSPSLSIPIGSAGSTTPSIPPPITVQAQPSAQVKTEPSAAPTATRPPQPLNLRPNVPVAKPQRTPTLEPPAHPSTQPSNGSAAPPVSPVRPQLPRSPRLPQPSQTNGTPVGQVGANVQQGSREQKQASSELLAKLQARQALALAASNGAVQQQQQSAQVAGQPAQQQQPQGRPQQQINPVQQQQPGVPPQPLNPQQQQPQMQQQQQRPPQQQLQQKPLVWQGEVSWTVHSAASKGGGNVLGCQVAGYAAHAIASEEFQAHTWPNRLHLSAVSPLQLNEIKRYVTSGRMPCITLATFHKPGTSVEDRQRGEQSYNSLARNLDSKKTMGHIRFGNPGCGMVIFAMGGGPGGGPKLMAMCFLKQPIPFATAQGQAPQNQMAKPPLQQQQSSNQQPYHPSPHLNQSPQIGQQGQMPGPPQQQQQVKPTPAQLAAMQQMRSNVAMQARQQQQQTYYQPPQQQQQPQQQAAPSLQGVNMTQEQIAAILAAHQQSQQQNGGGQGW